MRSTLPENSRPESALPDARGDGAHASLSSMVGIESRRFLKHPLLLIGALLAYITTGAFMFMPSYTAVSGPDLPTDLLGQSIIPAFFIGLTSLIVAARLTRSTDVSLEAVSTAPGTEARRTLAVAGACVVPLVAGLIWLAEVLVLTQVQEHYPQELWYGTLPAVDVTAALLATGVVSCLGGALLGVLVGRWLRFPGAPIVTVVAVVGIVMAGHAWYSYESTMAVSRLWLPWVMFHPGTFAEPGGYQGIPQFSQAFLPGSPVFYLLYVLVLCALAAGGAMWHDRTARTPRLRVILFALVGAAVVTLVLAMVTGNQAIIISDPLPILPQQ